MKEYLKIELDSYLKGVTEIFFSTKDTFLIAVRLTRPERDTEFEYIKTDEHFGMIIFSLWKVAQIEICKLVSSGRNQHYNLVDLIKKFEPGGKFENSAISCDLLSKWNGGFNKLEKSIHDITIMRDKSFAHTDKDREEALKQIKITISDFEEVLGLTAMIIRDIKIAVFEDYYSLATPIEEKPNLILPRLSYALEMETQDPELYKRLREHVKKD